MFNPIGACRLGVALLLLAGCAGGGGGGGGGAGPVGPSDYAVGGSIAGLVDSGLVVSNGGDTVTVAAGATSFTMPLRLAPSASYSLAVKTQPPGQTCILSGATGVAGAGSATAASISCDQWTWQSGSAANDPAANYGTLGVPAAGVTPGGLIFATSWTDATGSLWLFGGLATYGSGDQWRFDTTNRLWAWTGTSAGGPPVLPMARYNALQWHDSTGDEWIYGGQCFSANCAGVLGDLWRFSAATQIWTSMGGPTTPNQATVYGTLGVADAASYPGSRMGAAAWLDAAGNLWLHGGWSYNGNFYTILADDWKYDRATGYWAWMGGSMSSLQPPNYGTRGLAASTNTPGSRFLPQQWIDHSGRIWLFGGTTYDAATQGGRASDLWRLDPSTAMWTWIGGPTTQFDAGTRGQRGVPDSTNWPAARDGATTWVDAGGNLWMHGGTAHFTTGDPSTHVADDLWRYNPTNGIWTWMSGTGLSDAAAVHGNATGQATAGLTPGSRYEGVGWVDGTGTLWLFGGGLDSAGTAYRLGDLWSYHPPQFPAGQ